MLKLAITVVAIALPDCINPTLIAGELFVATGSHPRRRTTAFTLGAWSVTFVFGLALALGVGDLILSLAPKPSRTVKYVLITVAGVVLVIGGASIWIRRRALTNAQAHPSGLQRSPGLIGASIAGFELLTAFPYFAAIALIVGSGASNAGKLALLVLYCVVYTLPLILIAGVFAIMGERGEAAMQPIGEWLFAHWPAIMAPVTCTIGLAVLALGIVGIVSA